jgi:hypothetical protein
MLHPVDYDSVFTLPQEFDLVIADSPKWNPPPQPTITEVAQRKSTSEVPKTIGLPTNKKDNHKPESNSKTQPTEFDNNTVTTVVSHNSYSQNDISDLQSESRQHSQQLEDHIRRMNTIEQNVKQDIQNLNSRLLTLETRHKSFQKTQESIRQETLFKDVEGLASQHPEVTNTMNNQQSQITTFIEDQDEKYKSQQKEIEDLPSVQSTQTRQIAKLESLLLLFQAKSTTPVSQQKIHEKPRQISTPPQSNILPTPSSQIPTQLDLVMQSSNALHQPILSTPDTSFMESNVETTPIPTSQDDDQPYNLSPTRRRDMGNSYPGEET